FAWHIRTRQRLANGGEVLRRPQWRLRIDLDRQPAIAHELADPEGAAATDAASERANFTVDDRELARCPVQPRRCQRDERLPRRRRSLPHFSAATRQACAAAGAALVGADAGVAVDDGDPIGADAELLGRHLRD